MVKDNKIANNMLAVALMEDDHVAYNKDSGNMVDDNFDYLVMMTH